MGRTEYYEIEKQFNKLANKKKIWEVFHDVITMYAYAIQNQFNPFNFDDVEQKYKAIVKQYNGEEAATIVEICASLTGLINRSPYKDILSNLYMELGLGSNNIGQFFTPVEASKLASTLAIDIDAIKASVKQKGYAVIYEPTCGGGTNLISMCNVLYMENIDYQKDCIFLCQDINRLAGLMCYINLSLLGCCAVVKIGDTLSNPFIKYKKEIKNRSEIYTTPFFHYQNCYGKV